MADNSQTPSSEPTRTEGFEKLHQYFLKVAPDADQQIKGWEEMWQQKTTPWDHGAPNPAIIDTMKDKSSLLGSPFRDVETKRRKKALVPGCGRGYDVLLFASFGYDAYGVDSSKLALEEAWEIMNQQGKEQQYPLQNIQNGRGLVKFLLADFFNDELVSMTHRPGEAPGFDLIYDYTFLCALPPPLRPHWAKRMSQLLAPSGQLVCMEFPLTKPPKLGGPPYGLSKGLYKQLFDQPGIQVRYTTDGYAEEDYGGERSDDALVKVDEWEPKRSHRENSWVSIWQHSKS